MLDIHEVVEGVLMKDSIEIEQFLSLIKIRLI
jgi:hypothetical protein